MHQTTSQPTHGKVIYLEQTINLINKNNPTLVAELMKSGKVNTTEDGLHYLVLDK